MSAHPRPMPSPTDLEAERDRARTEELLEQQADADLAEHRARRDVGTTVTGPLAGAPW